MELPEYLRLVASRLEKVDKKEAVRLMILLRDTLNDSIAKVTGEPQ